MICRACGMENERDFRYCTDCGLELPASDTSQSLSDTSGAPCPDCGTLNPLDFRFCAECATRLGPDGTADTEPISASTKPAKSCRACGHDNAPDFRFCEECGSNLDKTIPVPSSKPHPTPVDSAPTPNTAPAKPKPVALTPVHPKRRRGRVVGIAAVLLLLAGGGGVALLNSGILDGENSSDDRVQALVEEPLPQQQENAVAGPGAGAGSTSSNVDEPDKANRAVTPTPQPQVSEPSGGAVGGSAEELPTTLPPSGDETSDPSAGVDPLQTPDDVDDFVVEVADQHASNSGFFLSSQTRSQTEDSDLDGMSDWLEDELIDRFKPVLAFDEEESKCADPWKSWAAIYQVTPSAEPPWLAQGGITPVVVTAPDRSEPLDSAKYAVITFVTAYAVDCGDPILGLYDHPGDTEAIYIVLMRPAGDIAYWDYATIEAIYIKRHYDPIEEYRTSAVRDWYSNHPVVWVSEAKHAQYLDPSDCEWYRIAIVYPEDCGGGPEILPTTTWMQNVGEIDYPGWNRQAFDKLGDSESSLLASMFPSEAAWLDTWVDGSGVTHKVQFCGGGSADECAGNLRGKWILSSVVPPVQDSNGDSVAADVDARISNIWAASDVTSDHGPGVQLRIFLEIDNHGNTLGLPVKLEVFHPDGSPVYTAGSELFHESGALSALSVANATAGQTTTYLEPFNMHIPYDQFYPGQNDYRFRVTIYSADGSAVYDQYETASLSVAYSDAISGGWISESGVIYGLTPDSNPSEYHWSISNAIEAAEYGTVSIDRYRLLAHIWGPDGAYWGQRGGSITGVYAGTNLPSQITWDDGGTWSRR